MCGRFVQSYSIEDLVNEFEVDEVLLEDKLDPSFNLAPSQSAPVIYRSNSHTRLQNMTWSFPAKHKPASSLLINARVETIQTKPSFQPYLQAHRCIIPANGFFEWTRDGKTRKQAHYIYPEDLSAMAFAGLWQPGQDSKPPRFVILTTQASPDLQSIHHRMPLSVTRDLRAQWLNPETDQTTLFDRLSEHPAYPLRHHAVSNRVHSPANNHPDLLQPALAQADLFTFTPQENA